MIVLMGSVGSGKTEQGTRLVKKLACPRISTSKLLRENPNGKWDEYIRKGKLVGDKEVIDVLKPALESVNAAEREFVLDGAPRSLFQAEWLRSEIEAGRIKLTAVIDLKVSDEVVLDRLTKRGREDDEREIVLRRLSDYHAITQPAMAYLQANGIKVHQVNGENDADTVEAEIDKILNI